MNSDDNLQYILSEIEELKNRCENNYSHIMDLNNLYTQIENIKVINNTNHEDLKSYICNNLSRLENYIENLKVEIHKFSWEINDLKCENILLFDIIANNNLISNNYKEYQYNFNHRLTVEKIGIFKNVNIIMNTDCNSSNYVTTNFIVYFTFDSKDFSITINDSKLILYNYKKVKLYINEEELEKYLKVSFFNEVCNVKEDNTEN